MKGKCSSFFGRVLQWRKKVL